MTSFDRTADVVVVGYGTAGAAAAIAAHDAGRDVVVVEKTTAGGGNAVHSGGFLFDVPGAQAAEHIDALCFGRTDRAVVDAYAAGLHELDGWLRSLGAQTVDLDPPPGPLPASFPAWPALPGGPSIRYWHVAGARRPGIELWEVLDAAVRERAIAVRHETSAVELVLDGGGTVTGVGVEHAGERQTVRAAGGVVLACGGFEADPELTDAYLPLGPTYALCHQANDGAGIRLAQSAGAALWHMYGLFGWFAFRTPEFPAPFALDFFAPGFVMVDADGRRFCDETGFEVHDRLRALQVYRPDRGNRPRLPSWAIFDDATRRAGPLNGMLGTPNDHSWSADNGAEVQRGWIRTAASVEELADAMGVERAILAETIETYNAAARTGRDDRFLRSPQTLVPLDTTRLYAIETWPAVAGTTGGPRHDARGRVLRPGGEPVIGLYAAGAVSLVWGHLIDFGGGLTDAMVFGRLAGADAAARAVAAQRTAAPA
ncbi:MAG TPA: FAD-binding protein [Solirubrobacteraceae bacterium]|jgi:succinate dehydrogenase/fumarate reductase flavoprotein subunit|nr:FAD-binding protein [Solirubrobacteraceae bacterium]